MKGEAHLGQSPGFQMRQLYGQVQGKEKQLNKDDEMGRVDDDGGNNH